MIVKNGTTDVTTYFALRDSTTRELKADITVTDIDLYYLADGAAMSSKADASALAAADSAHADNSAFNCGKGLYRIDWPDVFDGGVGKKIQLIVECAGVDTTVLEVELSPAVTAPTANQVAAAVVAHADFLKVLTHACGNVEMPDDDTVIFYAADGETEIMRWVWDRNTGKRTVIFP